jgi:predicted acylesterase/phospholipase RssA
MSESEKAAVEISPTELAPKIFSPLRTTRVEEASSAKERHGVNPPPKMEDSPSSVKEESEPVKNSPVVNNTARAGYTTLYLSGGGTKGYATLGALQYLYDHYYLPELQTIVGTSVGAMIGYLLILGYTPETIMPVLCSYKELDNIPLVKSTFIHGGGGIDYEHLNKLLEKFTMVKRGKYFTMESLYKWTGKSLVCCTYNKTKERVEYITKESHPDLPCLIALRMSSNLPLIFDRYRYGNDFYIDGGLSESFPSNYSVGGDPRNSIGVCLVTDIGIDNGEGEFNLLEYMYSLVSIPMRRTTQTSMSEFSRRGSTLVEINVPAGSGLVTLKMTSTEKLNLFSLGYNQCSKKM